MPDAPTDRLLSGLPELKLTKAQENRSNEWGYARVNDGLLLISEKKQVLITRTDRVEAAVDWGRWQMPRALHQWKGRLLGLAQSKQGSSVGFLVRPLTSEGAWELVGSLDVSFRLIMPIGLVETGPAIADVDVIVNVLENTPEGRPLVSRVSKLGNRVLIERSPKYEMPGQVGIVRMSDSEELVLSGGRRTFFELDNGAIAGRLTLTIDWPRVISIVNTDDVNYAILVSKTSDPADLYRYAKFSRDGTGMIVATLLQRGDVIRDAERTNRVSLKAGNGVLRTSMEGNQRFLCLHRDDGISIERPLGELEVSGGLWCFGDWAVLLHDGWFYRIE